jgi:hypothetical protein
MSEREPQTQMLGRAGEPCRSCGAPLAADQRYCLNCGNRRGDPRVDFRRHLPDAAPGATATNGAAMPAQGAAAPPPQERPPRDYAPLAAVGGIAVLGLMLLVGVLIGRGTNDAISTAPPQVVRVDDGDGAVTSSEGRSGEKDKASAKNAKAKAAGKKADDAGSLIGGKGGGGPVEASDEALKELEEQSPEEYAENAAKLPDEIATGGAPPPVDGKAPGGGSKGTAIE